MPGNSSKNSKKRRRRKNVSSNSSYTDSDTNMAYNLPTSVPKGVVDKLYGIFYNFLWDGKREKNLKDSLLLEKSRRVG